MRLLLSLFFFFTLQVQAQEQAAVSAESEPVLTSVEAAKITETPSGEQAEADIPLNLESGKKAATEESGLFRILMTVSILGLVGAGAVFFLRKYSVPKGMKHQTQIKVLQQHYLGPKKSLAIVRVAGESLLIGITDQNISMLKPLSLLDDDIPEEVPQTFGGTLAQSQRDDQEEPVRTPKKAARNFDEDEDFAISGIKDIVSKRLKGMRSLQ